MKKLSRLMSLLLIFGLVAAMSAFAADKDSMSSNDPAQSTDRSANQQPSTMRQSQMAASTDLFNASDLINKKVIDKKGDDLGKVEDVVLGSDGKAQFVVLERGGFLDIGTKYVPIPFKTFISNVTDLAQIRNNKDLTSNFDKSKIDSAPTFAERNWNVFGSQNKICSYFGPGQC